MSKSLCVIAATAAILMASAAHAVDGKPLVVVNNTRTAMVGLQLKNPGASAWQTDQLDQSKSTLGIQKKMTITVPANAPCTFDVKVLFEDGRTLEKKAVEVCKANGLKINEY